MNQRHFGNQAETFVAQQLQKQGFQIIARNYQKQYGEIDIIAQKDDTIAFVEVKVRRSTIFPMGELVPYAKQHKIALVAKEYIVQQRIIDKICRFDVALVTQNPNLSFSLSYIPNAFSAKQ